jgi:hypothetical protein
LTIRYKRPDEKNAISLVEAAEREMKYTLTLNLSEASAPTIIKNIYECFRMLGDSLLLSKGVYSDDHVTPIKELIDLKIQTIRPMHLIDNLRRLRININYYGYKPNLSEAEDAISIAKVLFNPVLSEVKKKIK